MAATPMTGGEALVRSLYQEGVRMVFGLPGVQLYGVMAALRDEPRIRFVNTRHEQATSFMADGYARAGGGVGTALVVPGPGLLNAMSGLSTAYSASSPVLMLSGQIPRDSIGRDIGLLHEVNDQQECIRPVTKWRRRVLQVADVPAAVREAMIQLRSGRPRPVEIEMPPETMEDEGLVELLPPAEVTRAVAPARDLDRAADLLLASRTPLIYAGGGVHLAGAHDALAQVAEHLQAGVAQSAEGKGAVSDHNTLSLGAAFWRDSALRAHIHEADVVLAVGSRLAGVSFKPGTRIVQIDADEHEIGRSHKDTLGLVGDARATLEALLERLRAASPPRPSRKSEHEALRARIAAENTMEPNASIIKSLRAGAPDNTILVAGMTQIGTTRGHSGRSTSRARISRRRTPATSATPTRSPWGRRSPARIGRWSRSPATAASSSTPRSSRPPRATASTWWRWSSTTAPTATWPATSTSPGAGNTAPS